MQLIAIFSGLHRQTDFKKPINVYYVKTLLLHLSIETALSSRYNKEISRKKQNTYTLQISTTVQSKVLGTYLPTKSKMLLREEPETSSLFGQALFFRNVALLQKIKAQSSAHLGNAATLSVIFFSLLGWYKMCTLVELGSLNK